MILISTALMMEARPLVERLGLSACADEPVRTFASDRFILVVNGTGVHRAATATGWAMGRFPGIHVAANIGFCGAVPEVSPLHRWNYIHSIRDQVTGRLSVPDILWRHGFPEAGLLTVPALMTEPGEVERVVDMEGSGFFEAARQFLSPDRIVLLKWVTDPLCGAIDVEAIGKAYAESLDPVVDFLNKLPDVEASSGSGVPEEWLHAVQARLRLSQSQSVYLKKWLTGHAARGGNIQPVLECLPEAAPANKRDNNLYFERLKDALKG